MLFSFGFVKTLYDCRNLHCLLFLIHMKLMNSVESLYNNYCQFSSFFFFFDIAHLHFAHLYQSTGRDIALTTVPTLAFILMFYIIFNSLCFPTALMDSVYI